MPQAKRGARPHDATAKLRVTLVPHTHWDRAWYLPFEIYRGKLVAMVDHLLDTLEADPSHRFTLDGQMVVVEDYLAVRPEQATRLRDLVQARRLSVGPWYILPDEFLVSGEALIRNLLEGRAQAEAIGRRMRVGYLPDPFGHISQLPQLLRGFDLDSFVFQRGIDRFIERGPLELEWEGPDGSRVLALWQRDGYGNADRLGCPLKESYDPDLDDPQGWEVDLALGVEQIRAAVAAQVEQVPSGAFLLGNGSDHRFVQPEIPQIAARAATALPELEVCVGDLEDHLDAVRERLGARPLERRRGELTYPYGDLLKGVYSARLPLKQANARLQTLLERYVEPVLCLAARCDDGAGAAWYGGAERPALLRHAWRSLLKNHPHDDICGCGVDQTHLEMGWRSARVEQVADELLDGCLEALGRRVPRPTGAVPHLLYVPLGLEGPSLVRGWLSFREGEAAGRFSLEDGAGQQVPFSELRRRTRRRVTLDRVEVLDEVEVALRADQLPGGGYRALFARPGGRTATAVAVAPVVHASREGLETPFHRIRIRKNGSLRLDDLVTGLSYRDLHLFEDSADAGDEYNYSPLPGHAATLSSRKAKARLKLLRSGPDFASVRIALDLQVPEGLNADRRRRSQRRRKLSIETELTVYAHSPRIDFKTRLLNQSRDHRLRVLFPLPFDSDRVQVDQAFDMVERSLRRPPARGGMPPSPTEHQQAFVNLQGRDGGLALLNRGLPEYEATRQPGGVTLALTLLRAVGWLSRDDFETRPFHAGPLIETPGAQCLGPLEAHYALLPHAADGCPPTLVRREALAFSAPPLLRRIHAPPSPQAPLPHQLALVSLQPDNLVLSAAKPAARSPGWVLRLFNPSDRDEVAELTLGQPAKQVQAVRLDEEPLAEPSLWHDGAQIRIACPTKKIVSLLLDGAPR